MLAKLVPLEVFNKGIDFKEEQPLNILLKLVPFDVFNNGMFFKEEQF